MAIQVSVDVSTASVVRVFAWQDAEPLDFFRQMVRAVQVLEHPIDARIGGTSIEVYRNSDPAELCALYRIRGGQKGKAETP